MSNLLEIDGRKTEIINNSLEVPVGLFFYAKYKGEGFDMRAIAGFCNPEGYAESAIISFTRENKDYSPDKLNYIVLSTDLRETYKATGIMIPPCPHQDGKFYNMGDDLEIKLTDNAQEAIEVIRDMPKDLMELFERNDGSHHYGMRPSWN